MVSRRLRSQTQLEKAATNSPVLAKGARGDGVKELQKLLVDLGFPLPKSLASRSADGVFGPETEGAVRDFQSSRGLKADGIVGKLTMAAFDDVIQKQPLLDYGDPLTFAADLGSDNGRPLRLRRAYHS